MDQIKITDEMMDEIHKLNGMDEDELYEILGAQILALESPSELLFFERFSKTEKIEKCKLFFGENEMRLTEAICEKWKYCEKREKFKGNFDTLIAILIPAVSSTIGFTELTVGVSAVLSVLLLNHKLDKFCNCN